MGLILSASTGKRRGYVDRILNGEKPADLPVGAADQSCLLVASCFLSLTVPQSKTLLLARICKLYFGCGGTRYATPCIGSHGSFSSRARA